MTTIILSPAQYSEYAKADQENAYNGLRWIVELPEYYQNFLNRSTNAHSELLEKDNTLYVGIYNGLCQTIFVIDPATGKEVSMDFPEGWWDEDEDGDMPYANLRCFEVCGFNILNESTPIEVKKKEGVLPATV